MTSVNPLRAAPAPPQTDFRDQQDREQAAHDLIVRLLVSPGQLFAGYSATSGPLEARFRLSVQNGVRTFYEANGVNARPGPSASATMPASFLLTPFPTADMTTISMTR